MAFARRHFNDVSRLRTDVEGTGTIMPFLVMSAEDMPRFGLHEPVEERVPIWLRAGVAMGGGAACWALIGAVWLLVH